MKRKMSWTPTPSHLMKQMPRKRGPRHKGLESTKWNDEVSYLSEKLMSFWAIFLVLHFASLICGNPFFGCYKGGNIRINIYIYIYISSRNTALAHCALRKIFSSHTLYSIPSVNPLLHRTARGLCFRFLNISWRLLPRNAAGWCNNFQS